MSEGETPRSAYQVTELVALVGVFALTLLACPTLLVLAAWPCGLEQALSFPVCLPLLPLGAWLLLVLAAAVWDVVRLGLALSRRTRLRRWVWGVLAAVVVIITLALLSGDAPLRVAFAATRGEWDQLQASVPPGAKRLAGGRVSIYRVEDISTDPRGGVYFRTSSTGIGIGPTGWFAGFAYEPNSRGTPYGSHQYELHHLSGPWYAFSATTR
jgi:hypothetical protein